MKSRVKEDKGNAMVVLGIMLIVVVLVVGGTLLDISKAFQMKAAYNDAAQKAAQASIRYQDSEGYLTSTAVAEALRVYETISRPATIKDGYMSFCNTNNAVIDRDVSITIRLVKDNFAYVSSYFEETFNSKDINIGDDLNTILTKVDPYHEGEIRGKKINGEKYVGLEMEILEATPNVILPSAAEILPVNPSLGDLGVTPFTLPTKCQVLGIRAGASIYFGEEYKHDGEEYKHD